MDESDCPYLAKLTQWQSLDFRVNIMSTIKKWEKMTQKSDIKDLAKKLGV
ncbi:hypothetical protein Javan570_0020 [Streptococcus phage Javan570]|nr:hypothetical protein Javan570_0020 [Streptococcus phage Javan570]